MTRFLLALFLSCAFFLLWGWGWGCCVVQGQEKSDKADSLLRRLATPKLADSSRAFCLCQLAIVQKDSSAEYQIETAQKGLKLAERSKSYEAQLACLRYLSRIYFGAEAWGKARRASHQALELTEAKRDSNKRVEVLLEAADIASDLNDYDQAISFLLQARDGLPADATVELQQNTFQKLAERYFANDLYDAALKYHIICAKLNPLNFVGARSLRNVGACYERTNRLDSSLFYYRMVHYRVVILNNKRYEGTLLDDLSDVHLLLGNIDSADYYARKSIDLLLRLNTDGSRYKAYKVEAELLQRKERFDEARVWAIKTLEQAQKSERLEHVRNAISLLYEIDLARRDFKNAYQYYITFQRINTELFSADRSREFGRMEARHEAEKEILSLESDKSRQQNLIQRSNWLLVLAVIGGLLMLFLAWFLLRSRNRERFRRAELIRLNAELSLQNASIQNLNEELKQTFAQAEHQRDDLALQNLRVQESLEYAARIQQALLPSAVHVKEMLPPHFVIQRRRSFISGDFLWVGSFGSHCVAVVGDAGLRDVPAAFLSVVGAGLLRRIVLEEGNTDPRAILDAFEQRLLRMLATKDNAAALRVGIEMGVLVFPIYHKTDDKTDDFATGFPIAFAGASLNLLVVADSQTRVLQGSPFGIGESRPPGVHFEPQKHNCKPGDRLFLCTDGLPAAWPAVMGSTFEADVAFVAGSQLPLGALGMQLEKQLAQNKKGQPLPDDLLLLALQPLSQRVNLKD